MSEKNTSSYLYDSFEEYIKKIKRKEMKGPYDLKYSLYCCWLSFCNKNRTLLNFLNKQSLPEKKIVNYTTDPKETFYENDKKISFYVYWYTSLFNVLPGFMQKALVDKHGGDYKTWITNAILSEWGESPFRVEVEYGE